MHPVWRDARPYNASVSDGEPDGRLSECAVGCCRKSRTRVGSRKRYAKSNGPQRRKFHAIWAITYVLAAVRTAVPQVSPRLAPNRGISCFGHHLLILRAIFANQQGFMDGVYFTPVSFPPRFFHERTQLPRGWDLPSTRFHATNAVCTRHGTARHPPHHALRNSSGALRDGHSKLSFAPSAKVDALFPC